MWRGLGAVAQHPDLGEWQEAPELDPPEDARGRILDHGWQEQGAAVTFATINPTSLPKYLNAILDMQADVIAVTETMAAARDFPAIEKRAQARGFYIAWGAPMPLVKKGAGLVPRNGGVALVSRLPMAEHLAQ